MDILALNSLKYPLEQSEEETQYARGEYLLRAPDVPLLSGGLQGETDAELASRLVIFHTALAAILTLHPNQGRIGEDTNEGEALWNCLHLY